MAEFLFFLFLVAPVGLIWWLFAAKRRADALSGERAEPLEPRHSSVAYEELTAGSDGLAFGRSYAGDDALVEPGDQTGLLDGIKAMEGRR